MRYFVTQEIKSETKMSKYLNLKDFIVVAVFMCVCLLLQDLVYDEFIILYYVFSALMSVYLILPSRDNPRRRNFQSLFIFLKKRSDVTIYKPIKNKELGR